MKEKKSSQVKNDLSDLVDKCLPWHEMIFVSYQVSVSSTENDPLARKRIMLMEDSYETSIRVPSPSLNDERQ